jgi:DNA-binding CsgD family transcriptional regulator
LKDDRERSFDSRQKQKGAFSDVPQKTSKKELARMKAMSELGESPNAIAKRMRKSHNTVQKYLGSDVYNDPEIAGMVETIKEKELADLYLLGAKGRHRLHELLDKGDSPMIPTIALVD